MTSPFYIEPAGAGVGAGLAGIGQILRMNREEKELKEKEEAARKEQADAQTALLDAWHTGDPSSMMEAAIKYPSISKMASEGMGLLQQYQKDEARDFAIDVLSNPEGALEAAQRRAESLKMQGRDPGHTLDFIEQYQQNPEGALKELEFMLAGTDPDSYKAFAASREAGDLDTVVVGDKLIDRKSGEVVYDGTTGQGGAESGLTPIWARDPETGKYTAFLPNKAGGMTPLATPEGLEMVPDGARMAYNPANILERSEAETRAERIKALPSAERAQMRRQQQGTLVDDTIDRALEKTSGWSTGIGSWLQKVPTTDANDLRNLLDTIKANVGFDKLQEMREQSPTGGALGPVSDFENRMLQSVLASLDQSQSKEQFLENLELVREQVRNIVHGSEQQFIDTYSGLSGQPASGAAPRRRYNPATDSFE